MFIIFTRVTSLLLRNLIDEYRMICRDLETMISCQFFMAPTDAAGLTIAFFKGPENITIELVQT